MKNFKRALSILLSALMIFAACSVSAFASEKHDPVIIVSGMGAFPLFLQNDDGSSVQVWGPSSEIIKDTVTAVLKKSVTSGGFVDGLIGALYDEMFGLIACDAEGNSINNITIPLFPNSVDNYPEDFNENDNDEDEIGIVKAMSRKYGAENVYFFNYDWRLDPLDDAAALNEYIQNVKAQKDADTVTLIPCSMGGIVTDAYLYKYGSSDVSKIIYCMVASNGVDMVGEMFNRNLDVSVDTLMEYFFTFEMGTTIVQVLISAVQNGLNISKLGVGLDYLIAKLLDKVNDKAYDELLSKTFACFPGIWAMVPDQYYESGKKSMFGDSMNSKLESRADEYHYNVICKANELVLNAQNDTDIYIIASYGYVGVPVTKYATEQTDCLIETKNEAFGATVAKYGETLGNSYTAVGTNCADVSHTHLSTDGSIDATTGVLPEQTWFIKNNRHVGLNCTTDCAGLITFLADTDGATVQSDENYPQFIELNAVTGKFSSLTGAEVAQQSRLQKAFARLIYIFKAFIDQIRKLFGI